MNKNIEIALNMLYQRQIAARDQLLNELLRVKITKKNIHDAALTGKKDQLFLLMKSATEEELGFFPADREDFLELYEVLKDIDPIEFTLEIYKNDRLGTITSPAYLSKYISEKIRQLQPLKILIPEAEKHLSGLNDIIKQGADADVTLTTQLRQMYLLLNLVFGEHPNVKIRLESIYIECLEGETFDYIYSLPVFGYRPEETGRFICRDSDGIAMENLLNKLSPQGTLDIIVPAKITFAGSDEKIRSYVTDNFSVHKLYTLPEGTFRPYTSIKTYFLSICSHPQPSIELGSLELSKDSLIVKDKKTLPANKFASHQDWRVLLSEDDDNIQRFRSSGVEKVKLKEVAEVFRGKSILKKDTSPGIIAVLNISNIEDGVIDYSDMDTIDEDERKIKRYELASGDVVLSCRGTAIKSAVFQAQDRATIASANLIIIRPKEKVRGEFIKIFLESPVGIAMIKSFQRGTTIMNINHQDIAEMEIPLLPANRQQDIITQYENEFSDYKETIKQAENRWAEMKTSLYNKLI